MVGTKVSALNAIGTTPAQGDLVYMVDDPAGTPSSKKMTVLNLLGPTRVNAKGFGALGDGSNDDTSAFQAAIDSMAGKVGTIVVPHGSYKVGSLVLGATNYAVNIVGEAMGYSGVTDCHLIHTSASPMISMTSQYGNRLRLKDLFISQEDATAGHIIQADDYPSFTEIDSVSFQLSSPTASFLYVVDGCAMLRMSRVYGLGSNENLPTVAGRSVPIIHVRCDAGSPTKNIFGVVIQDSQWAGGTGNTSQIIKIDGSSPRLDYGPYLRANYFHVCDGGAVYCKGLLGPTLDQCNISDSTPAAPLFEFVDCYGIVMDGCVSDYGTSNYPTVKTDSGCIGLTIVGGWMKFVEAETTGATCLDMGKLPGTVGTTKYTDTAKAQLHNHGVQIQNVFEWSGRSSTVLDGTNDVCYLNFGNYSFNGWLEVSIGEASRMTKEFTVTRVADGAVSSTGRMISKTGAAGVAFTIGDLTENGAGPPTEMVLPIYRLSGSANITVSVRGSSNVPANVRLILAALTLEAPTAEGHAEAEEAVSVYGGLGPSIDLRIGGTTHGTKGDILFGHEGTDDKFDETEKLWWMTEITCQGPSASQAGANCEIFGLNAGLALTTAIDVTAFGRGCLQSATDTDSTGATGFGKGCGQNLDGAIGFTGVGRNCAIGLTTGDYNVVIGESTFGGGLTTGQKNVACGDVAGYYLNSSNCVFAGHGAGYGVSGGAPDKIVAIGFECCQTLRNATNCIVIGADQELFGGQDAVGELNIGGLIRGELTLVSQKLGFFAGTTPVSKQLHLTDPTDLDECKARISSIIDYLKAYGLIVPDP